MNAINEEIGMMLYQTNYSSIPQISV